MSKYRNIKPYARKLNRTFGESVETLYPRVVHRQLLAFRRQLETKIEENIRLVADYQKRSLVRIERSQMLDDSLMKEYGRVDDELLRLRNQTGGAKERGGGKIPSDSVLDEYLKFLASHGNGKVADVFKPTAAAAPSQTPNDEDAETMDRRFSDDMLSMPHLLHVLIELSAQKNFENFPLSIANPSNVNAIFSSMAANMTKYIAEKTTKPN